MAYNKIVYGGDTLIDLTEDTVTPETLVSGYTAHDKTGALIEGTVVGEVTQVTDMEELREYYGAKEGFLLSYNSQNSGTYYIINNLLTNNGVLEEVTTMGDGSSWFLENEPTVTDGFYLYSYVNDEKLYIYNNTSAGANFLGLSPTSKTVFVFSQPEEKKFHIKVDGQKKWLQHSNSGGGTRLYTDVNNTYNSRWILTYKINSIIPRGTLTITENGEYDITSYKRVIVNVG